MTEGRKSHKNFKLEIISRESPSAADVLAPHNLPYQMFLLVQQMTKNFQKVLRPHRLTPLHWGVLCCLWKEDGLRTSEIAERLDQLGGTVTVGLDAMQARGLIKRRENSSDRRVTQIFLTPKAKKLQPLLEPAARVLITEIFAVFTREEYVTFANQIATLRRHLAESPEQHL